MPSAADIIHDAESLPVEDRARIIDTLLRSLNPPETAIDEQWTVVAKRRLKEIQSGNVKPISGNEVFAEIQKRFS